ncbi:uncharacterized protein LOC18431142 [Amborella trichopoda]|uniref:F-box domain-containing protein n=1 Tax=Amborella trichopoda TaxID=13333 RepID=W1P5X6_AMBTC|nr:uncharacterized protein LOC18431142 [Amborella trichopoda]ERN03011.1 hypothetical protein AMTR_s00207p00023860 [Amborella trichopoda]|eukprot:XP_006841336.1 uncharacterized protein LOC18431142 [Amborella trichopoda]
MEAGDDVSDLERLPESILLHKILSLLQPRELALLSCSASKLRPLAISDELWFPICCKLGLLPKPVKGKLQQNPYPWRNWHQLFCCKKNVKCIECNGDTPYVFKLTPSPVRLCERCEFMGQKYALATELEAKGRFLLTDVDLQSLPFKEMKLKRMSVYFFLRSSLENTAKENTHLLENEGRVVDITESNESGEECEEFYECADGPSEPCKFQEPENNNADFAKDGKKALRKEHKRLVKKESREKLMGAKSEESRNIHSIDVPSPSLKGKFKKGWKTKREHLEGNAGYQPKELLHN